jgi:capsule polysaccharide export protein KpsE/RkpR
VSQTGTRRGFDGERAGITEELEVSPTTFGQAAGERALPNARVLWANRKPLRKSLLVGLAVGVLIAFVIPPRYESTVQLMPPDNQSSGGMAMLAALVTRSTTGTGMGMGNLAGDLLGVKSSGALFMGILKSRTIEDRLVERFKLKELYREKLDEDARKELAQNTGVSEDRKSGIIALTVTDKNRRRAREMAMAYVEELNRLVAELSTSSAHRERVFLEERLTTVKQDLDQASREFSEFSSKSGAIDIKEQGRAMVGAAAALQGQLIAAESQLKGLEQIYTPSNVRVRSVQARITELQKQLEKLGGQVAIGSSPEAADSNALYPSLRKLPLLGVRYADLYRKAKIQEVVFETLTQQYELAKVQEAKEIPTVKMLDQANLPERRSFPPRILVTLMCGLSALLGTGVWVLAKNRWEMTDAIDPRKQFAQEVFLGMNSAMPWATPNGSRWQAATHKIWLRFAEKKKEDAQDKPR